MDFFVSLSPIARGEIWAVEGNLCLYPDMQNLENFGNGCKIRVSQSALYSVIFNMSTYRLGEQYLFYFQRCSRACILRIGAIRVS